MNILSSFAAKIWTVKSLYAFDTEGKTRWYSWVNPVAACASGGAGHREVKGVSSSNWKTGNSEGGLGKLLRTTPLRS